MKKILTILFFIPLIGNAQFLNGWRYAVCGTNNLLLKSQKFDDAAWLKTNSTITVDAAISPAGTTTADRITENGTNGQHKVSQQLVSVTGGQYTASFYAKANTRSIIWMDYTDNQTGDCLVFFDLAAPSATLSGLSTGTMTAVTYGIESALNGFYRCWITATKTSGSTVGIHISMTNAIGTIGYAGTTNDLLIWGAEFSAGTLKCYKETP